MGEARRRTREVINHFLPTYDLRNGLLLGYLVDITDQGLMLQSRDLLKPGTDYELRLQLKERLGGTDHLQLKARVIWSEPVANAVFNRAGFRLTEVDPDQQRLVDALIRTWRLEAASRAPPGSCNRTRCRTRRRARTCCR
jgi:Tfp pilus assembly protein PilZ